MDIAKEKQSILDYVSGLEDSAAVQELKNFIASLKKNDADADYVLTDKGLSLLEERRAEYLRGEYVTAEEADREIDEWLNEQ